MATSWGAAQNFNPIIPDNIADPSVSRFGDTFYLYGTTDIDQGLDKAGTPVVWKSKDFVNWSFQGSHISGIDWKTPYTYQTDNGEEKSGYFRYWAPGRALEKEGNYYLFPTFVKPEGTDWTYVMVAEHPEGPFRFVRGEGLFPPGEAHRDAQPLIRDIDGEPFVDDDGSAYIFWRRRKASRMSADYMRLEGPEVTLNTRRGGYSEGPVMFKRRGIYYYIYTLSGHQNYANAYMMSKEGPLTGYEAPKGDDIFIFSSVENGVWGPGHGNVFYDEGSDQYIFLYLEYGEGGTTRQVYANKMEFNEDGTIRTIVPDSRGVGYLAENTERRENIALGKRVTASSIKEPKVSTVKIETRPNHPKPDQGSVQEVSRTFTYLPENAVDGSNGSRWLAAEEDRQPWIAIDLGKVEKIAELQLFFSQPAEGHRWSLQRSEDGVKWKTCAEQTELAPRSPYTVKKPGKSRYFRLCIEEGHPGLWEWKIYN